MLTGCAQWDGVTAAMTQTILGTLKIGINLPPGQRDAALLAIEQADQPQDAVGGWYIQPVIMPAASSPEQARAALDSTLADRKVIGIVGHWEGPAAWEVIRDANQNGLLDETTPIVDPYNLDPCLTKNVSSGRAPSAGRTVSPGTVSAGSCPAAPQPPGVKNAPPEALLDYLYPKINRFGGGFTTHVRNYFRLSPTSDEEGGAAADYTNDQLDGTNALVIDDGTNDHGLFADSFVQRFLVRGGKVAGQGTYDFSHAAFSQYTLNGSAYAGAGSDALATLMSAAKQAGVDVVVAAGTAAEDGTIRGAMVAAGFDKSTPLLAGPDVMSPAFAAAAGPAADGTYAVNPMVVASQWDTASDFLAAFQKRYGHPPTDPTAAYAYDAVNAMLAVLRSEVVYVPVAPSRTQMNFGMAELNYNYQAGGAHRIDQPTYEGALGRVEFDAKTNEPSLKLFSDLTYAHGSWNLEDQGPYRG